MTHKSLFKEAAQHFVQRGQTSDEPTPSVGQALASLPPSLSGRQAQMSDRTPVSPGEPRGGSAEHRG